MTTANRVLIVDDMHLSLMPLLQRNGYEPFYAPTIKRAEILQVIGAYHGLIIRSKTNVDQELIDRARQLKFVARAGAGVDKVDKEYLESKGIEIINAPEGNRDSLGEHTLGMLLAVLHRINVSFQQVKNGIWDREGNRGIELRKKVVGIYGVGYMGQRFAQKLSGLGCKVVGYDKYKAGFGDHLIEEVALDQFKAEVEILSIHVPLTVETKHLFNQSFLRSFPNLKVVINTARGEVLKTADLVHLLEEGAIYGATLDVLENEKPGTYSAEEKEVFDKLCSFDNVLVTPHVGGWSYESYERINRVLVRKIVDTFAAK